MRSGRPALAAQADEVMAGVIAVLHAGPSRPGDAGPEGICRVLASLAGALSVAGEHGLAALADRLRRRILSAAGEDGQEGTPLAGLAAGLRSLLRDALARSLQERPLTAADLLPAWQALAGTDEASDPAPLMSLQAEPGVELPVPAAADEGLLADAADMADPVAEAERSLLVFLRHPGERRAAVRCLAGALARVAAASDGGATRQHWLVMHAYLTELADGHLADPERAGQLLARLLRALRHRTHPSLPALLMPLARRALFELSQAPVLTDEGRQVARAFRLGQQWSPTVAGDLPVATASGDPAGERFVGQLDRWIAAREAGNDGLGPVEDWRMLAGSAAQSDRFLPLAATLRQLEAQWPTPDTNGGGLAIAAAMLCLQAWAKAPAGEPADSTRIAELLQAAADTHALPPALPRLARQCERQTLMGTLAAACGDLLESGERWLDLPAGQPPDALALGDVRRLLEALAGAARLMELPGVPSLVEVLLAQLEAVRTAEPGDAADCLHALALTWVVLAEEVAMLPWTADGAEDLDDSRPPTRPQEAPAAERGAAPPDAHDVPDVPDAVTPVDPLVAIFLGEAARLLARLRAARLPGDMAQPDAPGDALHAAHTLAGCAATVGLPAMGRLAQAVESLLERGMMPPGSAVEAAMFGEALDTLETMLAEFAETGRCRDADELIGRLAAGAQPACAVPSSLPGLEPPAGPVAEPVAAAATITAEAAGHGDDDGDGDGDGDSVGAGDDELLAIFREEAADLLPRLEQALQQWQQSPDDSAAPAALLRLLHTLKGSARMAGQLSWGETLHRCETEVAELSRLPSAAIGGRLGALQVQIDEWQREWSATSGGVPACADDPDQAPGTAALPAAAGDGAEAAAEPMPELPDAAAHPLPAARASASMLRVRAGAFDAFADAVADLWAGHARLADELRQQRRAVSDLGHNLARLRAQVRELEIDAESRIVSGASAEGDAGFDPLELDRYTRLHEITRMIAESVADLTDLQRGLSRQGDGLSRATDTQARDLRGLQSGLRAVRSQPFGTLERGLRHLLRQAARESGREVELSASGTAAEVDRALLDRLSGPLGHVLRNAVVHGIEPPSEREALGKPRIGRIELNVLPSAAELRIELADDGRGLDLGRIRDRASAIGLLAAPNETRPADLHELIFQPGFSTASEVTALAGRGIGLDAVRAELQALGGQISVDSRAGQGCRFTIRVPQLLATLPVLLVRAGRHRIGLLAAALQQVLQLRQGDAGWDAASRTLVWQGEEVPLQDLGQLLGEPRRLRPAGARQAVAVLQEAGRRLALKLDAVDGQRELIVRSPGAQLSRVAGLTGTSVLGDGGIALIVDPFRLAGRSDPGSAELVMPEGGPRVLVVDDSLTVRRAMHRLLERHGYQVELARDGIEALALLRERQPAAVLLDIEMPRMDGFQLLAAVRNELQLRELPVVMITSRIAGRHRQRAQELGASAYMGKPCREQELLSLLSGLCPSTSGAQDEGRMEKQSRPPRSEAAA